MKPGSLTSGGRDFPSSGDQAKGTEMKGKGGFERNGEIQIKSNRLSLKTLKGHQKRGEKAGKQTRSLSGEKIQPEAWCSRKRGKLQ